MPNSEHTNKPHYFLIFISRFGKGTVEEKWRVPSQIISQRARFRFYRAEHSLAKVTRSVPST